MSITIIENNQEILINEGSDEKLRQQAESIIKKYHTDESVRKDLFEVLDILLDFADDKDLKKALRNDDDIFRYVDNENYVYIVNLLKQKHPTEMSTFVLLPTQLKDKVVSIKEKLLQTELVQNYNNYFRNDVNEMLGNVLATFLNLSIDEIYHYNDSADGSIISLLLNSLFINKQVCKDSFFVYPLESLTVTQLIKLMKIKNESQKFVILKIIKDLFEKFESDQDQLINKVGSLLDMTVADLESIDSNLLNDLLTLSDNDFRDKYVPLERTDDVEYIYNLLARNCTPDVKEKVITNFNFMYNKFINQANYLPIYYKHNNYSEESLLNILDYVLAFKDFKNTPDIEVKDFIISDVFQHVSAKEILANKVKGIEFNKDAQINNLAKTEFSLIKLYKGPTNESLYEKFRLDLFKRLKELNIRINRYTVNTLFNYSNSFLDKLNLLSDKVLKILFSFQQDQQFDDVISALFTLFIDNSIAVSGLLNTYAENNFFTKSVMFNMLVDNEENNNDAKSYRNDVYKHLNKLSFDSLSENAKKAFNGLTQYQKINLLSYNNVEKNTLLSTDKLFYKDLLLHYPGKLGVNIFNIRKPDTSRDYETITKFLQLNLWKKKSKNPNNKEVVIDTDNLKKLSKLSSVELKRCALEPAFRKNKVGLRESAEEYELEILDEATPKTQEKEKELTAAQKRKEDFKNNQDFLKNKALNHSKKQDDREIKSKDVNFFNELLNLTNTDSKDRNTRQINKFKQRFIKFYNGLDSETQSIVKDLNKEDLQFICYDILNVDKTSKDISDQSEIKFKRHFDEDGNEVTDMANDLADARLNFNYQLKVDNVSVTEDSLKILAKYFIKHEEHREEIKTLYKDESKTLLTDLIIQLGANDTVLSKKMKYGETNHSFILNDFFKCIVDKDLKQNFVTFYLFINNRFGWRLASTFADKTHGEKQDIIQTFRKNHVRFHDYTSLASYVSSVIDNDNKDYYDLYFHLKDINPYIANKFSSLGSEETNKLIEKFKSTDAGTVSRIIDKDKGLAIEYNQDKINELNTEVKSYVGDKGLKYIQSLRLSKTDIEDDFIDLIDNIFILEKEGDKPINVLTRDEDAIKEYVAKHCTTLEGIFNFILKEKDENESYTIEGVYDEFIEYLIQLAIHTKDEVLAQSTNKELNLQSIYYYLKLLFHNKLRKLFSKDFLKMVEEAHEEYVKNGNKSVYENLLSYVDADAEALGMFNNVKFKPINTEIDIDDFSELNKVKIYKYVKKHQNTLDSAKVVDTKAVEDHSFADALMTIFNKHNSNMDEEALEIAELVKGLEKFRNFDFKGYNDTQKEEFLMSIATTIQSAERSFIYNYNERYGAKSCKAEYLANFLSSIDFNTDIKELNKEIRCTLRRAYEILLSNVKKSASNFFQIDDVINGFDLIANKVRFLVPNNKKFDIEKMLNDNVSLTYTTLYDVLRLLTYEKDFSIYKTVKNANAFLEKALALNSGNSVSYYAINEELKKINVKYNGKDKESIYKFLKEVINLTAVSIIDDLIPELKNEELGKDLLNTAVSLFKNEIEQNKKDSNELLDKFFSGDLEFKLNGFKEDIKRLLFKGVEYTGIYDNVLNKVFKDAETVDKVCYYINKNIKESVAKLNTDNLSDKSNYDNTIIEFAKDLYNKTDIMDLINSLLGDYTSILTQDLFKDNLFGDDVSVNTLVKQGATYEEQSDMAQTFDSNKIADALVNGTSVYEINELNQQLNKINAKVDSDYYRGPFRVHSELLDYFIKESLYNTKDSDYKDVITNKENLKTVIKQIISSPENPDMLDCTVTKSDPTASYKSKINKRLLNYIIFKKFEDKDVDVDIKRYIVLEDKEEVEAISKFITDRDFACVMFSGILIVIKTKLYHKLLQEQNSVSREDLEKAFKSLMNTYKGGELTEKNINNFIRNIKQNEYINVFYDINVPQEVEDEANKFNNITYNYERENALVHARNNLNKYQKDIVAIIEPILKEKGEDVLNFLTSTEEIRKLNNYSKSNNIFEISLGNKYENLSVSNPVVTKFNAEDVLNNKNLKVQNLYFCYFLKHILDNELYSNLKNSLGEDKLGDLFYILVKIKLVGDKYTLANLVKSMVQIRDMIDGRIFKICGIECEHRNNYYYALSRGTKISLGTGFEQFLSIFQTK